MAVATIEDRLRLSFQIARDVLVSDGKEVTPSAIVFRALEEAMETLKKLPDPEKGWLYSMRTVWPEVIGDQGDAVERYKEMLERLKAGEESVESIFRLGGRPSPSEVARMEVVLQEFPKHLVGRNKRRDWKILSGYAQELPPKIIARIAKCGLRSCQMQKNLQCNRISAYYRLVFPEIFGEITSAGTDGIRGGSGKVLHSQL